ncbi:intercellular adhesion molecule 1-like isoform X2 [Hemicordylus capensis]|uniref:intercellular adhesion molecule 1-like isoform X2 n=1 Tax=Hemicordylus capensis TaxID=884348 RepID=UPI002304954D|nr:intercellular adhesion molecule 1-like isoform X2 [Hemicordylus capensis]
MTAVLLLNLAVLLNLCYPVGAQEGALVRIQPERAAVAYGGSIVFNCSASCKDLTKIGLETKETTESKGNGTTWAAFQLVNVSEWDSTPKCYARCNETTTLQSATLTVYRSPEQIVLDPLPEMEVGKEYNLTCRVTNVAPRRNLTVTFLKGEMKLHQEAFKEHSAPEAGDVVATHSITAQLSDYGKEFSCQAALDLRPEGQLFEKASSNQSLKTVGYMEYRAGEKIEVECHGEGSPLPEFEWEVPSSLKVVFSDSNKTLTIESAEKSHNGTYRCLAHNMYGSQSAQADIIFKDRSRSWVAPVVVVMLLAAVGIGAIVWYRFRK